MHLRIYTEPDSAPEMIVCCNPTQVISYDTRDSFMEKKLAV